MIDPKELMIGNLVRCENEIERVEGVNKKSIDLCVNQCARVTKPLDLINSIPLNEEVLFLCGFEKHSDGTCLFKKENNFIFIYENDLLKFCISDLRTTHQMSLSGEIVMDHIITLHQLQNLYFIITGEKLTLKD